MSVGGVEGVWVSGCFLVHTLTETRNKMGLTRCERSKVDCFLRPSPHDKNQCSQNGRVHVMDRKNTNPAWETLLS